MPRKARPIHLRVGAVAGSCPETAYPAILWYAPLMPTLQKFNAFEQDVGRGVHNLSADVLKVALSNTVPVATDAILANISQLTTGNGYAAGGNVVPFTAYAQAAGIGTLTGGDVTFQAAGGSLGPFRYAVLYNATASGGPLIGWWDLGTATTLAAGNGIRLRMDATNGILRFSASEYTLAAPTPAQGAAGLPSGLFVVTRRTAGSLVTVTPSDGGAGGTFTPTTVTLGGTIGNAAHFTYTPAAAGSTTITTTNSGGLLNPAAVSYLAFVASTLTAAGATFALAGRAASLTVAAAGNSYYVAATAGSGGAGTLLNPWKLGDLTTGTSPATQGVALTTPVAGDTLYFRGGTYHIAGGAAGSNHYAEQILGPTHSGTSGSPITLRNYPGESVNIVLDSGEQPAFGTANPAVDHVRFLGLTVTASVDGPAFYISGTGHEIGYCKIVGQYKATVDNHDGINLSHAYDFRLHHSEISGVTGDFTNSSGFKVYKSGVILVEDNYIHDCTTGVYDKDGGDFGEVADGFHVATYRRNYIIGNASEGFQGSGQGRQATFLVYDNVIGNTFRISAYNDDSQVYNNLLSSPDSSAGMGPIVVYGEVSIRRLNLWNNVTSPAGSTCAGFWDSYVDYSTGLAGSPLAYMDYNVYTGTPGYHFGGVSGTTLTEFTLAQFRVQGFETHSSVVANSGVVYANPGAGNYTLNSPYNTAGRYGDAVGPRVAIGGAGGITDAARYGPAAMP
jgi:hypothetical protein